MLLYCKDKKCQVTSVRREVAIAGPSVERRKKSAERRSSRKRCTSESRHKNRHHVTGELRAAERLLNVG